MQNEKSIEFNSLDVVVALGGYSCEPEIEDSFESSFSFIDQRPCNRRSWIFPPPLIEFSTEVSHRLFKVCKTLVVGNISSVEDNLTDLNDDEASCLHAFIVNLYTYGRAVPEERRPVALRELLYDSICRGPEYAAYIDKMKMHLLGRMHDVKFEETAWRSVYPETLPNVDSVGDIYRPNFLFRWYPKDPDFVEIVSAPLLLDLSGLEEFRKGLRSIISESRKPCFDNEWRNLDTPSSKTEFFGAQWMNKPINWPAQSRQQSRIVSVPRELSGSRVATVECQESVVRVRWIEREVKRFLKSCSMSGSVMTGRTRQELNSQMMPTVGKIEGSKRSAQVVKDEYYIYCRDFQKEGLTKPRELLRIMLEELHEAFPEALAFECPNFFDYWNINVERSLNSLNIPEDFVPVRGHGLGMANALTTLMQLTIQRMNSFNCFVLSSRYDNDDACVSFDTPGHRSNYVGEDRIICSKLGLMMKPKSTFTSKGFSVLCECYVSTIYPYIGCKDSFPYMEAGNGMMACCASQARSLVSTLRTNEISEQVIRYWGWLLYRNEHLRPFELGGWTRKIVNGIDITYDSFLGQNLCPQEDAAYYALNVTYKKSVVFNKKTNRNKIFSYLGNESISEMRHISEFLTARDFKLSVIESNLSWKRYESFLKKNFLRGQRYQGKRLTYDQVFRQIVKENPRSDYVGSGLLEDRSLVLLTSKEKIVLNNPFYTVELFEALKEPIPGSEYVQEPDNPPSFEIRGEKIGDGTFEYVFPSNESFKRSHRPLSLMHPSLRNREVLVTSEKQELLDLRRSVYGLDLDREAYLGLSSLSKNGIRVCRRLPIHSSRMMDLISLIRFTSKHTSLRSVVEQHHCWTADALEFIRLLKPSELEEDDNQEVEIEKLSHPKAVKKKEALGYSDELEQLIDEDEIPIGESNEVLFEDELEQAFGALGEEEQVPGTSYNDDI